MAYYIEFDCSKTPTPEYQKLVKAIGNIPAYKLGSSLAIYLKDWNEAKKRVLKQSKQYSSIHYGLVEVIKGKEPVRIFEPSEVFSDEFLEMERSLSKYQT